MMIDHLVYATPDLEGTVAEVERLTGVRPVEGGPHPGKGTRNFLLGLGGDSYLEIIGPDAIPQGSPHPPPSKVAAVQPFGVADLTGPRLVTWAVRVRDIEAAVRLARSRGYDPGEIEPMSRRTPDGELLEWRLTRPAARSIVPFLIDWGETLHPARRGLRVVPLISFSATHPDPARQLERLAAIDAGLEVRPGEEECLTAVLAGTEGPVTLT